MPVGRSALYLAIASALCCGRGGGALNPGPRPTNWTTGFWFWDEGRAAGGPSATPVDVLFCKTGTIGREDGRGGKESWPVYGRLPDELPAAREYWLVFRSNRREVPPLGVAPELGRTVAALMVEARGRGLSVAGIQLDIDSPTRTLREYAAFLREVKKHLEPGVQVSITALLDWFNGGTAVGDVVAAVDEFVPQFYDVQDRNRYGGDAAIAARIDGARWGPVFNRYQKRFRVGISTFGRSRYIHDAGGAGGRSRASLIGNVKPLDVAVNPSFQLQASRSAAGELVLTYRASGASKAGYNDFAAGDAIEFTVSSPESIGNAVAQAKLMRDYCAGVLFFRWPTYYETLTAQPEEVLAAAGVDRRKGQAAVALKAFEGGCAVVSCSDLYLSTDDFLSDKPLRYRVDSSVALDYFLPKEGMPVRMSGPARLTVSLPAYCGRGRMYLGRAVTAKPAEFRIEEER